VIAVAEMLQRSPLNGHGPAYVQTILDSSQTLLRILNDTIDLSRARRGRTRPRARALPSGSADGRRAGHWLPRAQQDGVSLNVAFDGPKDARRGSTPCGLKQVLNISSATPSSSLVRAGSRRGWKPVPKAGRCACGAKCATPGPGIPPEALERIFEPFVQDERGVMSAGAGLGLAICAAIIEAMDGRLWARSNAGAGATFALRVRGAVAESLERAATAPRPPRPD
jgi:signal transduction histidine kinase